MNDFSKDPRLLSDVAYDLFPQLFDLDDLDRCQVLLDLSVNNPRVFSIIIDAVSLRQHLESGKSVM